MAVELEPLRLCQAELAESTSLKERLAEVARAPVCFDHVTPAAWGVVASMVAGASASQRIWMICDSVRQQESFYRDLLVWNPGAFLYPERELTDANGLEDPTLAGERLAVVEALSRPPEHGQVLVVLTAASLQDATPSAARLSELRLTLRRGAEHPMEEILRQLADGGYERVGQISERGQFAVRGGIVDVFSWQHGLPCRLEWFGDRIDSIRQFDLDDQISVEPLDRCELLAGDVEEGESRLGDFIAPGDLVVDLGKESGMGEVLIREEGEAREGVEDYSAAFYGHDLQGIGAGDLALDEGKRTLFFNQLNSWLQRDWSLWVVGERAGELERFDELARSAGCDPSPIHHATGELARGFLHPAAKIAVLSEAEIFGRHRHAAILRSRGKFRSGHGGRAVTGDYSQFSEGDLVVHLECGVGRFCGLQRMEDGQGDVLELEFAEGARLFVPLEQSHLVSRYVGLGKREPPLSKLGDARWAGARKAAAKAVEDFAAKMLQLQARRETVEGYVFSPDGKWQTEFEDSFPFRETADQLKAIAETKQDMESPRPMDRLICGDVGFGKTEVAIRAAFKAVMDGKQVAVLTPTTVLAQQHYETFRERMSEFPVVIELLSRFRSRAEQRAALQRLRNGEADIVVGTHRLLSKDVVFRDLGLVVLDEEQRFGVRHKERLKERFETVDVLTLSATPIPRTLYLSLTGLKNLSTIETPPPNRFPVETVVAPYDERLIRSAIERELARQGQVYFLHNRVGTIENMARRLQKLHPKARIEIGHGQMEEDQLENVMQRFVRAETDILVCTTIIESGLDIPNANTIIIDRADRFGLADLYQLRGRVGRAQHKAYAYLLLPPSTLTVGEARKRISAIKQYSTLGAGFKVAMRDLEIRGAGSLLGTAQSGHITAVGFELYCRLLKKAVARLRGGKKSTDSDVPVRVDCLVANEAAAQGGDGELTGVPAYLPSNYVGEPAARLQSYRKVAEASAQSELDRLRKEWRDRFGPLPLPAENLLTLARIRIAAGARQIEEVEIKEGKLMIRRRGDYLMPGGKFPRLTSTDPKILLNEVLKLIRKL